MTWKIQYMRIAACVMVGILLFCAREYHTAGRTDLQRVAVSVVDETGEPVPVRVRFTDMDSTYFPPEGHTADFPLSQLGDDVFMDNNRRFAYVEGNFQIDLPSGPVSVEIVKGYAYRLKADTVAITPQTTSLDFRLEKWFEFPDSPWYSGDVHVHHIDPARAALQAQAEDLNVCNILTSDFTTDQQHFKGRPEPQSDPDYIVYVNQEYRESRLGHINLLNLKQLVQPVEKRQDGHFPLLARACDETHQQGGHVSWAHFAQWPGLEGPLAILNGRIDAVELLCNVMPFHFAMKATADIVPEFHNQSGVRLWYRLLNCGLKVPLTAGTDKMSNFVTVGGNRVFAKVDGAFTYDAWIDALNKGRTFVSNSPFLFLEVNGEEPGAALNLRSGQSVTVKARVWSQLPLDRLEIIANGELIAEQVLEHHENYGELQITYKPEASVWFAARAYQFYHLDEEQGVNFGKQRQNGSGPTQFNQWYGTLRPETAFAHTSPVFCSLNNRPFRSRVDAEYFMRYMESAMRWLKQYGSFPDDNARQTVIKEFQAGYDRFAALRHD